MVEQAIADKVAAFRFQLIVELLSQDVPVQQRMQLVRSLTVQQHQIPGQLKPSTISETTIRRWITQFRSGGLESLKPQGRSDLATSRAIPPQVQEMIVKLKKENPQRTVPIIIKELHLAGYLDDTTSVSRTSVYRFLEAEGLKDKSMKPAEDRRKFAYPHANDMWQGDCARGPNIFDEQLGRIMKTYLFVFVDDCTRVIPHAQFYYQENCQNLEHAFRQAILKKGLPVRLFCDNGAEYIAKRLVHICAILNIALIHCRPYSAASKGKVERLIRTVRQGFLNYLDVSQIKCLPDLNSRLWTWVESEYHRKKHSGTEQVPIEHFMTFADKIRYIPKNIDLDKLFMVKTTRQVYNDRTIRIEGKLFEVPGEFVGKKLAIGYIHDNLSRVWLFDLRGNPVGEALPVDIQANCRVKRNIKPDEPTEPVAESTGINFVELMYAANGMKNEEQRRDE